MSPSAPRPPPAAPDPPARPALWTDRLTTGVLALSIGVMGGVAGPPVLRAAGVTLPVVGASPSTFHRPLALPHPPRELTLRDDPSETLVDPDQDGDDPPLPGSVELGLTRGTLTLHERPDASAEMAGELPANELVTILRDVGDWVLVYHNGPAGPVIGYAKKSEIAIR